MLQGQSGRVWKISPPPGFDHRTVQPVASRYTDRALPAHGFYIVLTLIQLCACVDLQYRKYSNS